MTVYRERTKGNCIGIQGNGQVAFLSIRMTPLRKTELCIPARQPIRTMKAFKDIIPCTIAILLLAIALLCTCCRHNIIMIGELKGSNWEQYIGKRAIVMGIFVVDPLPMLVTDLKIVTANVPMPDDQYLLLTGKEVDKINPREYGGAKISVFGMVREAERAEVKYAGERVILEVLRYKILEVPSVPYVPTVQDIK